MRQNNAFFEPLAQRRRINKNDRNLVLTKPIRIT
jgi:hypothetical protein